MKTPSAFCVLIFLKNCQFEFFQMKKYREQGFLVENSFLDTIFIGNASKITRNDEFL
ncbi:hypothetical protein [Croceitalea rosinachiae]|uniref:Uncharacterized protein n=1 Tax=Croceitalea rosinachiae TaxID=3075596 RepID=A0ABU3AC80_9FLAO|nr:hypothetical protein [Croceitalea sp. F388]MDT0606526.1 hypothetical protein [Croceitalea sp. F388]